MKIHQLKQCGEAFNAVRSGEKKAEVRVNDRDFQVGDMLVLREYVEGSYTGRVIKKYVTHMQTGFGLPDGLIVLSIK